MKVKEQKIRGSYTKRPILKDLILSKVTFLLMIFLVWMETPGKLKWEQIEDGPFPLCLSFLSENLNTM